MPNYLLELVHKFAAVIADETRKVADAVGKLEGELAEKFLDECIDVF